MCEERTDDASRNLASTEATGESRKSFCEKIWARRLSDAFSTMLTTFENHKASTGESM
jgi:hypothetical protein